MDQITLFTAEQAKELAAAIETHGRPAQIDWVNRTIVILSDLKTHPWRKLSSGRPMQWRDYLYRCEF